jgi:hypothetical protein
MNPDDIRRLYRREMARAFIRVIYSLSTDDAFALDCAALLIDLKNALKPPPRGKRAKTV